mmetsp:Transcript_66720/g.198545  ORF Transcript_66720/g.198545 Transcript_66720/m.198545 type:complete len:210 (-) Transcript_66720:482-1111(-)
MRRPARRVRATAATQARADVCAQVCGSLVTHDKQPDRHISTRKSSLFKTDPAGRSLDVPQLEDPLADVAEDVVRSGRTRSQANDHRAIRQETLLDLEALLEHRLSWRRGHRLVLDPVDQLAVGRADALRGVDVVAGDTLLVHDLNEVRSVRRVEAADHNAEVDALERIGGSSARTAGLVLHRLRGKPLLRLGRLEVHSYLLALQLGVQL